MVLTVKPLPNASDSNKQGEGHGLKPKTVMNSGYFWDNYSKFRLILKVNKLLYLGKWTFIEMYHFQDKLEGKWIILDHKMHEGRAWIKTKRIITGLIVPSAAPAAIANSSRARSGLSV